MRTPLTLSLDIYLVCPEGGSIEREGLRAALRGERHLLVDRRDPDRLVYHNRDTGAFFSILLAPGTLPRRRPLAEYEEGEGDGNGEGMEEGADAEGSDAEGSAGEAEADGNEGGHTGDGEDGEAEGDGEEEEDEEEEPHLELPPVTVSVPLLCPTFCLREALGLAVRLGGAAGLAFELPTGDSSETDALPHAPTQAEDLASRAVERWTEETRRLIAEGKAPEGLQYWSPEAAERWWAYGTYRQALEKALEAEGVKVPPLQLALHQGRLKTLCVWNVGEPTVLPRCDLVLLRRERHRKGLLFTRKVADEGLVAAGRIWDLLGPFSEIRREPVELLIFREAGRPPQQVAAELEVVRLEPVEGARRTQVLGVVDIEAPASGPHP